MYFVISVFPISMTSGALLPASVASNFRKVRAPRLVLDVDVPARVRGLELGVRGCDDLGPPGLRVDLEPDGEGVCCLAARGTGRADRQHGEHGHQ